MTYNDLEIVNSEIKTIDLKGKNYAEVAQRVQAFRKLFPEGFIKTDIVKLDGEVCIIKAKDGKTDNVKKAVESRLDSQKEVFKDYQPAQYDKLCNSSIKTEGDYVYWVCTNDNSKAKEKLTSFFE